jgi:hypothetical protein
MADIIMQDPVLNPPHQEPSSDFVFNDDGIMNEIPEEHRRGSFFSPVPSQTASTGTWISEGLPENEFTNNVRQRVTAWREGGLAVLTGTTWEFLDHWHGPIGSGADSSARSKLWRPRPTFLRAQGANREDR